MLSVINLTGIFSFFSSHVVSRAPWRNGRVSPANTFIFCELEPVQIHEEKPQYPRLAQEGGFTAYVLIQAFVDKNGDVIVAQAVKCNRPNMGFEEAAVKAAYKNKFKPAIQNDDPIGVWIGYRVEFELKEY